MENIRRYFEQKRTKYQTHFLQVEMCKIYIFMIDNKLSKIFLKVNGNTRYIIKKRIEI